MSTAADMDRFDTLVEAHRRRGATRDMISTIFGYKGKNGDRDVTAVREGRSKKYGAGLSAACDALESAYAAGYVYPPAASAASAKGPGANATGTAAAGTMQPATLEPEAAALPSTNVVSPAAVASERKVVGAAAAMRAKKGPSTSTLPCPLTIDTSSASMPNAARFATLVVRLNEEKRVSKAAITVALGFSGKNAKRDLESVTTSASKKVSLDTAIDTLEKMLADAGEGTRSP
jgi:hypothetical protein